MWGTETGSTILPLSSLELLNFWGKLGTGRKRYWGTPTLGCGSRTTNLCVSRLPGLLALQDRARRKK